MALEKIESLLERIAVALESKISPVTAPQTMVNQDSPFTPPSLPQTKAAPVPTFPPQQPATALPFSNQKEVIGYIMKKYTDLGKEKGALIQGVLDKLGCTTVHDLQPEHYAALYTEVEKL